MSILIIVFVALFSYYLRYLYIFYQGLKVQYDNFREDKPFVSIIIAAKNEEETLPELLSQLINQDYAKNKYEVIIADDESSDKTPEIVVSFQEYFDNLHLLPVKSAPKNVSRKKNALSQAVSVSKGEIIISTDADCQVKPSWISTMVKYFSKDVGLVAGLSLPQQEANANFVQKFEYFDMLVLFTAAAGSIGAHKAFSCSGQNLAYTRQAFEQVGGYSSIKNYESGDDVLLMQLLRKAGYRIRFAFDPKAYNTTVSEKNIINFLNQRIRWATNERPQSFLNREFLIYLIDVFLLNLVLITTLILNPVLFLLYFIIKLSIEFTIINHGRKRFDLNISVMRSFPIWSILHPFYVVITGIGEKLNLFKWKK